MTAAANVRPAAHAPCVAALRPHGCAGASLAELQRAVDDAELGVDLQGTGLHAERAALLGGPGMPIDDLDAHAAPHQLVGEHEAGRAGADNQDVRIHIAPPATGTLAEDSTALVRHRARPSGWYARDKHGARQNQPIRSADEAGSRTAAFPGAGCARGFGFRLSSCWSGVGSIGPAVPAEPAFDDPLFRKCVSWMLDGNRGALIENLCIADYSIPPPSLFICARKVLAGSSPLPTATDARSSSRNRRGEHGPDASNRCVGAVKTVFAGDQACETSQSRTCLALSESSRFFGQATWKLASVVMACSVTRTSRPLAISRSVRCRHPSAMPCPPSPPV